MPRPRIFICSAKPRLTVASALQTRLEIDFEVTLWDQGIFRPSTYPIPSLLKRSKETDFAIQIIAPDVIQKDADGSEFYAPNSNVLVELGLFMGALGQERVFLVAPSSHSNITLPSDLESLTLVPYDDNRDDHNLDAAVGSTAHLIKQEIETQWPDILREQRRWYRIELFQNVDFRPLIEKAKELTCCYIHSRRWRENHGEHLKNRIREGTLKRLKLYLPDIRSGGFIRALAARFDDELSIPAMILDAFNWVDGLAEEFKSCVSLSVYSKVPVYSFYIFEDSAVIAFYTLARIRRTVPAPVCRKGDEIWDFMMSDLEKFDTECENIPANEIKGICATFASEFGLALKSAHHGA